MLSPASSRRVAQSVMGETDRPRPLPVLPARFLDPRRGFAGRGAPARVGRLGCRRVGSKPFPPPPLGTPCCSTARWRTRSPGRPERGEGEGRPPRGGLPGRGRGRGRVRRGPVRAASGRADGPAREPVRAARTGPGRSPSSPSATPRSRRRTARTMRSGSALTQGYLAGPNAVPPEIPFRGTVVPPGRPGAAGCRRRARRCSRARPGTRADRPPHRPRYAGSGGVPRRAAPRLRPSAWQGWLADLSGSGATSAEVADVVRALGAGGGSAESPAAAAGSAEVLSLVVDRGEGGVRVGGGPTVPVAPRERVEARAVLERLGKLASLAPAARDPPRPRPRRCRSGLGPKVHRPVAVAGARPKRSRSAGMRSRPAGTPPGSRRCRSPAGAAVAAGEFVDKADGVVTAALAGGDAEVEGGRRLRPGDARRPGGGRRAGRVRRVRPGSRRTGSAAAG